MDEPWLILAVWSKRIFSHQWFEADELELNEEQEGAFIQALVNMFRLSPDLNRGHYGLLHWCELGKP